MLTSRFVLALFFFSTSAGLHLGQLVAQSAAGAVEHRIVVPASVLPIIEALKLEPDHGSSPDRLIISLNPGQLAKLERMGIRYQLLSSPKRGGLYTMSLSDWQAASPAGLLVPHDAYPSYALYEHLMTKLARDYAHICRLHELGRLESGHRILALEITDQPDLEEEEPKFFYTSTMHGDELAGYPMMLFLIEELLQQYDQDPDLTDLVNSTEIWINPLANPDGTYAGGNHSVASATRRNRNGVDLNRNFPDPNYGVHPDGEAYQPETEIFMDFHQQISFDLSCNLHSGAEVFNYPWDTYGQLHPDDDWWRHVGREFAGHMHDHSDDPRFFRQLENGITNGYSWYHVKGGRQDYVTYFHRGREATLEIEGQKALAADRLESLWQTSRPALFAYIQQANNGLRGTVTDVQTGQPVQAQIRIPGHDELNSEVFTKMPTGRYHRYLKAGSYTFEFSADGYETQTITQRVIDQAPTYLYVKLKPEGEVR